MKRTPLGPGAKSLARGSTFAKPRSELRRSAPKRRRKSISPASPEQREKVKFAGCVVCQNEPCHPAHLIDRSIGGDDNPLAVVPLCFLHHREYDDGRLSLLEHLEPSHREEVAYAVKTVGLVMALQRITNCRWQPEPEGS
jgi:hypothetical protein